MKVPLESFLRHGAEAKPTHAICLFAILQIYFAGNLLSFGFWKSSGSVFAYMLVFYGVWLAGLVLVLSIGLATALRFHYSWIALAVLVVLSIPFAWDIWLRSLEIDSRAIRWTVRILLLPTMYLYFRIGLKRVGWTACVGLLLCILAFAGHAGLSVAAGGTRDFVPVELDKRPNVHVIMLDSFTHSPFAKEFMDVENRAADYLATLDDTIYAGSLGFVEKVPTIRSWQTLFNLGQWQRNPGFFSGATPSRLTALLRRSGYNISTGFSNDFFGWYKGDHVDHYYRGTIHDMRRSLVCAMGRVGFGFCSEVSRSIFFKVFVTKSEEEYKSHLEKTEKAWADTVVDLIDRAERERRGPLFSAFHIYWPIGHTSASYRHDDAEMVEEFREYFVRGVHRARQVLEEVDRLRKRYRESIFIVSGDHGPWLSRAAPEEDRRFFVLDRHGVALALLNASNLCAWSREWLAEQRYLTPSRMLVAALTCNGESRRLTEHFTDNEEFIRFGNSFTKEDS